MNALDILNLLANIAAWVVMAVVMKNAIADLIEAIKNN